MRPDYVVLAVMYAFMLLTTAGDSRPANAKHFLASWSASSQSYLGPIRSLTGDVTRGCRYGDGSIAGRVRDAYGRPAQAYLTLESTDHEKCDFSDLSDNDGFYEFQDIPSRRYLLSIVMATSELGGYHVPRSLSYYFPGTTDRSQASTIDIPIGGRIDGLDIQLPSSIKVIDVQGTVSYSNGDPAPNVDVRIQRALGFSTPVYGVLLPNYHETQSDEYGGFKLQGYLGVTYNVIAFDGRLRGIEECRPQMRIETEPILLLNDIANIKLIIPKEPGCGANKDVQRF